MKGVKSEIGTVKIELSTVKSELSTVKSQLDKNTQMTRAIHDRQEETDARLESFSLDFHKMHGEITALKENSTHMKNDISSIKDELAFLSHKTYRNEAEIFKLRRGHSPDFENSQE